MEPFAFVVPGDAEGERLDRFLTGRLDGITRSAVRRAIDSGRVRVDGRPAQKAGLRLESGSAVSGRLACDNDDGPVAESIPLDVIYEDDAVTVINKAAGMVVHPGHGHQSGTLVNALLGRGTELARAGAPHRPGIVHRLDRGTSGILVVARTDEAHHALATAFARREVQKRYVALVWGHPRDASGTITHPIGRSRTHPTRMAVGGRGSREAISRYAARERLRGFSLLDVYPTTGRTHQIRVHLQSIHHPIVGDDRYGGRAWRGVQDPLKRLALRDFDRLALHAAELRLTHPTRHHELILEAPLPAEFKELLLLLRET